jgi:hypothetical protein
VIWYYSCRRLCQDKIKKMNGGAKHRHSSFWLKAIKEKHPVGVLFFILVPPVSLVAMAHS